MNTTLKLSLIAGIALILSACGGDSANTSNAMTCPTGQVRTTSYGCQPQGQMACPAGQVSTMSYGCVTGSVTGATTCTTGYVSTQYGCMPQAGCQAGYGMYNNQCIPATVNNMYGSCTAGYVQTQYGCMPQAGCQAGYGMYNNQCIPATVNNTQYPYNNGYNNGYPYNNGYNNGMMGCPAGSIMTQMGCLSQGPCPMGYVLYNNQCYRLIQNNYGTGGGLNWYFQF